VHDNGREPGAMQKGTPIEVFLVFLKPFPSTSGQLAAIALGGLVGLALKAEATSGDDAALPLTVSPAVAVAAARRQAPCPTRRCCAWDDEPRRPRSEWRTSSRNGQSHGLTSRYFGVWRDCAAWNPKPANATPKPSWRESYSWFDGLMAPCA
jgi:hypothetical protein